MKLKFKNQQYQLDATQSVIDCFLGQPKETRRDLVYRREMVSRDKGSMFEHDTNIDEFISHSNQKILIPDYELRKNITDVQRRNEIQCDEKKNLTDFSIEMETGTGKTYVFTKTMYELYENYGWSKYIIMVPSIAIREGIRKSLETTEEHFFEQYKKKIRYFVYDSNNSSNIVNIQSFAEDTNINVMIINHQAFNSRSEAARRIYMELDELASLKPIDLIKSVNPILILDEPQKIGGKTEQALEEFNPLFKLRYSATHKKDKEYNKIYRLDAVDAYNQKLVKKIYVKGIEVVNDSSIDTYMYLDSIVLSDKKDPIAKLEIQTKTASGVKKVLRNIDKGTNLYDISGGLTEYKGYVVSEINCMGENNKIVFTNGKELEVGKIVGNIDPKHIARIQIRETIKSHIEKERELYKQGIKVLSLFFIDEVAKYKYYEESIPLKGEYALIFEEEYEKVLREEFNFIDQEYQEYLKSFETKDIHAGYFSIDKKGQEIDKIDDKREGISFDVDAYNLIMKDKERLLSLQEPVRFIFSHSALREGWDNPNIFQICTLKRSQSDMSKRQEIGRGLRICVNNNGERMDTSVLEDSFHNINKLTVIPSESYEKFASELQTEILKTLSERPKHFKFETIHEKELRNEEGEEFKFTQNEVIKLLNFKKEKGYAIEDEEYKITEKFYEDLKDDNLEIPVFLKNFKKEYINLMKNLFARPEKMVHNADANIRSLKLNENFEKEEFKALWNKINIKTVYEVDFDTEKLIENSVDAINKKLVIAKPIIKVSGAEQRDEISDETLKQGTSFVREKDSTYMLSDYATSSTRYDLIGEISKETALTRKTIVEILQKILPAKFDLFKENPEEFIRKVSNLINEEKAILVIKGITYHKIEERYDNTVFVTNNINANLGINAFDVKKNIYDYLITDSNIEREFGKELELAEEVVVYAKLPNGFKIPTPVGNYTPDWAIVLEKEDIKHIYFIAETKGTTTNIQLRPIEQARIECAEKHFQTITDGKVKYKLVSTYSDLREAISS